MDTRDSRPLYLLPFLAADELIFFACLIPCVLSLHGNKWLWFGIGIGALLAAVLCHTIGSFGTRRFPFILSFGFSSVGCLCVICAYFRHALLSPSIATLLRAAVPAWALALLLFFIVRFGGERILPYLLVLGGMNLIVAAAATVGWVKNGTSSSLSFCVFACIVVLSFTALTEYAKMDDRHTARTVWRYISFAGFGFLIPIALIVLFLLAGDGLDCDLDCCDCGDGAGSKKRKKKKNIFKAAP